MSGKHPLVQAVENAQLKTDIPAFEIGRAHVLNSSHLKLSRMPSSA